MRRDEILRLLSRPLDVQPRPGELVTRDAVGRRRALRGGHVRRGDAVERDRRSDVSAAAVAPVEGNQRLASFDEGASALGRRLVVANLDADDADVRPVRSLQLEEHARRIQLAQPRRGVSRAHAHVVRLRDAQPSVVGDLQPARGELDVVIHAVVFRHPSTPPVRDLQAVELCHRASSVPRVSLAQRV